MVRILLECILVFTGLIMRDISVRASVCMCTRVVSGLYVCLVSQKMLVIRISFDIFSAFGWLRTFFGDHPNSLDGGERPFVPIHLWFWMVTEGFSPLSDHILEIISSNFATILCANWCWNWCGSQVFQDSYMCVCFTCYYGNLPGASTSGNMWDQGPTTPLNLGMYCEMLNTALR